MCPYRQNLLSTSYRRFLLSVAGLASLELAAFCVTGRRSNQLIYSPKNCRYKEPIPRKGITRMPFYKDSNLPPNGHEVAATKQLFYSA